MSRRRARNMDYGRPGNTAEAAKPAEAAEAAPAGSQVDAALPDPLVLPLGELARGKAWARSHLRFVLPLIHFIPD